MAQTQEGLASLRRQLSGDKHNVQSFSARLTEYSALQTQLEGLEKLHDAASERPVKIEAREGAGKDCIPRWELKKEGHGLRSMFLSITGC